MTTDNNVLIKVDGLQKSFGDIEVLKGIDAEIKKGDVIGLDKGKIVKVGKDMETVTTELIDSMMTEDKEVITLYYGADVTADEAEAFAEKLQDSHPDAEVILHYGGQPLYYYVLSVE